MSSGTRDDLEDRRISAETEKFIAEAEQARQQAHVFYQQSRLEPARVAIGGVAAGAALVLAIIGILRLLGLPAAGS